MTQWPHDPARSDFADEGERTMLMPKGDPLTDPIPGFPARGIAPRPAPSAVPDPLPEPLPARLPDPVLEAITEPPTVVIQDGWSGPLVMPTAPTVAETAAPPARTSRVSPAAEPVRQGRHSTSADSHHRRDGGQRVAAASWGWRGAVRRWSGGTIRPAMGLKEVAYERDRAMIQKDFGGPRTIAFVNPKGGAAKTTSALAAGFTFGTVRGGGVVAWDNNETRGTLGIRGLRGAHRNTTRELLDDLGRFKEVFESGAGDLATFVRSQGDARFDVLASDERPDVTGMIKGDDFAQVHRLLASRYEVILVDTGNNLRAENWLAAAHAADVLVVTSTVREDTGYSGLWMLDALQDSGYENLKYKTITVLSDPSPMVDPKLVQDLEEVYEQRTRAVYRVPYDPALVAGSVVPYEQLSEATTRSWLRACAGMAAAL
jgi:MinD-like ATPase involved in chromosome partitioning or flagellar assembly